MKGAPSESLIQALRAMRVFFAAQEAVMTAVELRFPTLLDLAQERARKAKTTEALRLVLTGLKTAPNEEVAYHLLNLLAA